MTGEGTYETPILPEDIRLVETDNGWSDLPAGDVRARRALTESDALYDVGLLRLPAPLEYSAPTYWKTHWFDEADYPADAELVADLVRYRGGLESPASDPAVPTVEDVEAESGDGGVTLSWTLVGPSGTPFDHPLEVTALRGGVPVAEAVGTGEATLDLEAGGEVTLRLLSQAFTIRLPRPLPGLAVRGRVAGENRYVYTYELEEDEDLDYWTDPFGDQHTESPIEIERTEAISRHVIRLSYPDETRSLGAHTSWDAPDDVQFTRSVSVGETLRAGSITRPEARATRYSGTRETTLSYDLYEVGRYHVEPVGYLPPGTSGELEDYVQARFVGPAGETLERHVAIDRPTELAIRIWVTATEEGRSPVIYGARTVRD